jgi:hypothetical protein
MHRNTRGRRGARNFLITASLTLVLAGCTDTIDSIVEVTPRDQIDPEALGTADGATALYNGAIDRFSIGFSGNNGGQEGIAIIGGTMADEWFHSGTFSTRFTYDQRQETADNGTVGGALRNMHTARVAALRAYNALLATGSTAAADSRVGEMRALEAFGFILGAETFCNGLPYSEVEGTEIVYGDPLTGDQANEKAIERLDEALAGAAGPSGTIANLARVLKARALMNLGKNRFSEAASVVASVPDDFQYFAFHSTQGNRNGIFVFNTQNERFSLAHNEGTNGLPFRGAGDGTDPATADPRIPWTRTAGGTDVGFDNNDPQYDAQKWLTFDDDVVIASGIEARLIEAEALLNSGGDWLGKLNALRATVTGLAPLADPGSAAAREDMVFSEKAFWLFGEAHRFGDMRRLLRQYSRAENTVFPIGNYHEGGVYGTDVTFPIHVQELNNPLYKAAETGGQLNLRGCFNDNP